jgi:hypothetical protein
VAGAVLMSMGEARRPAPIVGGLERDKKRPATALADPASGVRSRQPIHGDAGSQGDASACVIGLAISKSQRLTAKARTNTLNGRRRRFPLGTTKRRCTGHQARGLHLPFTRTTHPHAKPSFRLRKLDEEP